MAVIDIDRVFFCRLYGNTEDDVIIRELRRDMAYEEEMIFLEQEFWNNYVQKQVPPPYLEDGDVILASARQYCGKADKDAEAIIMALERFDPEVTHMIVFDALSRESSIGDKGDRMRLFLT